MAWTALLVCDGLLMLTNVGHKLVNDPSEPRVRVLTRTTWDGGRDGSHAELLGHAQLVCAAVVLCFLARQRRASVWLAWAVVLVALVADDVAMLHEAGGGWLATRYQIPTVGGVRAQDVGELLVWAGAGAVLVPLLVVTHLRAGPEDRRGSRVLFGWAVLLGLFAVVLDVVAEAIKPYVVPDVQTALLLLETAGELVTMTGILIATLRLSLDPPGRDGPPDDPAEDVAQSPSTVADPGVVTSGR